MNTKRDRYHAHRFVVRRGVYALLHGEPDSPEAPLRKLGMAGIGGLIIAVILVATYAIIGLLHPGSSGAWRQPGTLIVERETGTRYVLLDGALHPVLNYASARLLLDGTPFHTSLVASSALAGVPHGTPVGIPAAPDYLPATGSMIPAPWVVCAEQTVDAGGGNRARAVVSLGAPVGGRVLDDGSAALVVGADGTHYFLWHGRRHKVADPAVLNALGYTTQQPMAVADSWLSAMPTGPDLAFPDVPRRGQPGPPLGQQQTLVGQVIVVTTPGAGTSYYLILSDGLSPVTAFGAALVLGDPRSRSAYPGHAPTSVPASAADVTAAPRSGRSLISAGYPAAIPQLADSAGQAVCASFGDGSSVDAAATVFIGPDPAVSTAVAHGGVRSAGDVAIADVVRLCAGCGLIARSEPAAHVTTGAVYLLTDLGVKYPLASVDVLPTLGYSNVQPALVSSTLLSLVPTGPTLDPTAARQYLAS
jgi:type VII secretion protein EccB